MRLQSFGTGALLCGLAFLVVSCASTSQDIDTTPTARITVDAHVGKSLTSDGTKIEEIADKFAKNETVYAVVNVPGRHDGALRVRWMHNGTQVREQTVALNDDVHNYTFQLDPGGTGHQTGDYTLEIYVDNDRKETEGFTVI